MNSNRPSHWLPILLLAALLAGNTHLAAQTVTTNSLPGRTIVKLQPDYLRPRVYALNSGAATGGIGSLVALDATNGAFLDELTLGSTPTDMDIELSGQFLYVIHFGNNTIVQVNLDTFTLGQTRSFPPPGNHGSSDHYNLRSGRNNRLYWLDGKWAPALHIMDFSTGAEVGAYDSGEGFGNLAFPPDRNDLFVWRQYGWNAGNINSWIWRLSVSNDTVSIKDTSAIGFYRDPLDTPLLISGNGDRAFLKHRVVYTTNLTAESLIFTNNDVIYSITYYGDVAFSTTKAYNARNGALLYTLPISTPVQTVSADQQRLFLWDTAVRAVVTVPMGFIAPVPSVTMSPTPADLATVSLPLNQLAWSWPPGALAFRVFFGTNAAEVAAAGTNSPLYRGQVPAASLPLTNALATGSAYYWRVDLVGLLSVSTGPVWRFDTAPVITSPLAVSVTTIATFNAAAQTLNITSGGSPQPWILSENIPWLTASVSTGVTPATVTLNFQNAALPGGTYTGAVQVTSGAAVINVPVTLEIVALDLVKMVTDYKRPYIYALQRSPGAGKPAALLFINTETEQIEKALPILTDPRDLSVHPREDKLYIVDWLTGYLRVVDLTTQLPLPSLAVHVGLDRVNPGRAGRVIMEDWNQWVGVYAVDTTVTTNGMQGLVTLREGDGETSPDGRYYYHCDNNSSGAAASKWDMNADGFVQVGGSSTGHPYGSRQLYLSPDGSRLFWQGYMYDTALSGQGGNVMQELAGFGQQIWASTSNAWFAIGDSMVFDTRTQAGIFNLGFSTGVKALSRDDSKLFQFNTTTRQLVVTPMSVALAPRITAHPASATVLAGTTATFSAAGQGASPLSYEWLLNGTPIVGASNLNLTVLNAQTAQAGDYALRVSSPYGSVTSAVAVLTVLVPPAITAHPQPLTLNAGATAVFSVTATGSVPMTFQWQRDGVNLGGANAATLAISNVLFTHAGAYRVQVLNGVGSAISTAATLTVISPPLILQQPASATVRAGSNALFSVNAVGTPVLNYQWQFEGADIPGATNASLALSNVPSSAAGSYWAVLWNAQGYTTSAVATLTVLVPPAITQSPTNLNVVAGSNALFTVSATGTGLLRYQWQFEGVSLAGATNSSLALSNVQSAVAGAYRVIVTNLVGSAVSPSAILRVLPGAPRFVQHPADTTVAAGDAASLMVEAAGSEPISFRWFFGAALVPGAGAATLTVSNAQAAKDGNYFCTASNAYGTATSLVARLTVVPRAPVIFFQPLSRIVLAGNNAGFSVGVVGSEPMALQWRLDGVPLPGHTNAALTVSNVQAAQAGGYDLVATNALGGTTSLIATLTVNVPARIAQPPASRLVMLGDSVVLNAGLEGTAPLSVQWQFNGTNLAGATSVSLVLTNVTFAQAGSYRVNVSNPYGAASATATLTVLPRAGLIVAWGDNSAGQAAAPAWTDIVRVAGGNFHSLALHANGSISGWGDNFFGQAVPPAGLSNVTSVAAGDGFSLALRADGTVAAWGDNSSGQASVPAAATNIVAVAAGQAHALVLRANGTALAWGNNVHGQAQPPQNTDLAAIAAGEVHNLALRRNGLIVGWGNNAYGQAAPPVGLSNVIAIAAGYLHSLALRADGTVAAWGDDTFGQITVPADLSNVTAIAAGEIHSSALRADGSVVTWGDGSFGQLDVPASVTGALALASGYYHQAAILPLPALQYEIRQEGLVLRWNGACKLQWSASPSGPFTDLEVTSPWTNQMNSGPRSFYRLRRQP